MKPSVAVVARARVGEGPVWDAARSRLLWVDILAGQIHLSDPSTGATTTLTVPTLVGAAVLRRDRSGYVAAVREGFAEISPDGVLDIRNHMLPPGHRMNDAKCDPWGRLWAGSNAVDFTAGQGALHVLSSGFAVRTVLDGLTLPNGLGWSPDGRTFYLVDTLVGEICSYRLDPDSCALTDRRQLRAYPVHDSMADGLCVDAQGCLWVARWGGGRIERLSPDGDVLSTIELPVAQTSSCAFGGTGLTRLFVTSAREGLELPADEPDGSVYVLDDLDVAGLPVADFAG